jgi:hypothetical protein
MPNPQLPTWVNEEAFLQRLLCDLESHCWRWMGAHNARGYGSLRENWSAHQIAYLLWVGPIPYDEERQRKLDIDHVADWDCIFKDCCNPGHLELTTNRENFRRARSALLKAARARADKITHCPQNHEYTPENTRMRNGKRACIICIQDKDRARGMIRRAEERRTCSVSGCNKTLKARGWCSAHYKQFTKPPTT